MYAYVKVEKSRSSGRIEIYDSDTGCVEPVSEKVTSTRRALMEYLNNNFNSDDFKIVCIYEVKDNSQGNKEIVCWLKIKDL